MIDYENYMYNTYMIPAVYKSDNNLLNCDDAFLLGNIDKKEYIPYKNYTYYKPIITNEKEALLYEIQKLCFYCHELNLYLDLDSDNKELISMFVNKNNELKEKEIAYQNLYGPLNVYDINNMNKWIWKDNPWPWCNKGDK